MTLIIALSGFSGCGKDTVADYLVKSHRFKKVSFASHLKDVLSLLFGWERDLLEGSSKESRVWRETPDRFWSQELGYPVVPKQMLQYFATDIIRTHLHKDFWALSLKKQIKNLNSSIVISDLRFENEYQIIKDMGGIIWRVKKQEDPSWFLEAKEFLKNNSNPNSEEICKMQDKFQTHFSEWSWSSLPFSATIKNDSSVENLYQKVNLAIFNATLANTSVMC